MGMEQILLPRKVIKAKNVENVKALKTKNRLKISLESVFSFKIFASWSEPWSSRYI